MIQRFCEFSPDRVYRYRLELRWGRGRAINFVMLNPSTADENKNDPTVERCMRRALMYGHSALIVTNLFAFRATDPKVMLAYAEPIGTDNDRHILQAVAESETTICAWGKHGAHMQRDQKFWELVPRHMTRYLRLTKKSGHPEHPLYIPYSERPKEWDAQLIYGAED